MRYKTFLTFLCFILSGNCIGQVYTAEYNGSFDQGMIWNDGKYFLTFEANKAHFYPDSNLLVQPGRIPSTTENINIRKSEFLADDFRAITDLTQNTIQTSRKPIMGHRVIFTDSISYMPWKLLDSVKICSGGSLCKMASLDYGYRKYIAWYIPSIPTAFGVYFFHGLPGLMAELDSEDGQISFKLNGLPSPNHRKEPKFNKGKYGNFSDYEKQVIRFLIKVESYSTAEFPSTNRDPSPYIDFEVDRWSIVRRYKLAEFRKGNRKILDIDQIDSKYYKD